MDKGYTLQVNGEVSMQREMTAPPGQFIALQAFNVLKETLSGMLQNQILQLIPWLDINKGLINTVDTNFFQ